MDTTPNPQSPHRLEFADELAFLETMQKSVFDWYVQAEAKAQIILGITGVFLSLIVGAILLTPTDVRPARYSDIVLLPTILFYAVSVTFAVIAIWSRAVFRDQRRNIVFFGAVANYRTASELKAAIHATINTEAHLDQLRASTLVFARNTRLKHRLVNLAALFSGLGLINTLILIALAVYSAG